jgi:hypothetical protein
MPPPHCNKDTTRAKYSLLNPKLTIQHEHYAADDMNKVQELKLIPESLPEELHTREQNWLPIMSLPAKYAGK